MAIAVLPARFASSRLPGKPLLDRTGKPLIQHVVERVRLASRVSRVVVATDDRRIFDAVAAFGGEAVMTGEHPNGTARIAEAIDRLEAGHPLPPDAIVVNVQGDEPEVEPQAIDAVIDALAGDPDAPMATVATPFPPAPTPEEGPANPNLVKVVLDRRGRALYFSRSPIPFDRDSDPAAAPPLRHLGLYAYRRAFLPTYLALAPTPLEAAEKLEQLRALEHGHPIAVSITRSAYPGIDTPDQYEAFVRRQHAHAAQADSRPR